MTETLPDVRSIELQASQIYKRIADIQIHSQDDFSLVAQMLLEVKRVANKIRDEFSPAVESAYKAHKQMIALRDKAMEQFESAEMLAKEKMLDYRTKNEDARADGVMFRKRYSVFIDDASAIGREYMKPDLKRIEDLVNSIGPDAEEIVGGIRVVPTMSVVARQ